jgi:hypothetical protein
MMQNAAFQAVHAHLTLLLSMRGVSTSANAAIVEPCYIFPRFSVLSTVTNIA